MPIKRLDWNNARMDNGTITRASTSVKKVELPIVQRARVNGTATALNSRVRSGGGGRTFRVTPTYTRTPERTVLNHGQKPVGVCVPHIEPPLAFLLV